MHLNYEFIGCMNVPINIFVWNYGIENSVDLNGGRSVQRQL